jgi:PBSX family phage portal protein
MGVTIKKPKKESQKVSFVQKVIKEDTYLVMAASQYQPEDEFVGLYYSGSQPNNAFIEPPYNAKTLAKLVTQNNILAQCVEAFEVNIDGTGHEFVAATKEVQVDLKEEERLRSFFDEPFPNTSFVTIRRELRRDLESCGYACLEVLRNLAGDLLGLRYVRAHTIRYVRLDAPTLIKRVVLRDGKEVEMEYWERERRFAQRVSHPYEYVYFKEYGATRRLHRKTGEWKTEKDELAPEDTASELLVFRLNPDVDTPYGVPRWINQLPSVLGSRKAEEANLETLDAGGMPPAIIFVEGGQLAGKTADTLRTYLSGQLKARARAVVVEVEATGGSLDTAGKTQVRVERFGSEGVKDGMYASYDARTEERVRVGFRLPPLFIGKANDYSYASAQVSYMVAEAQVFMPEREEFDEIINRTVMKELGAKTCKFKSQPITLKDLDLQLKGLGLVSGMVEGGGVVEEVNKITGLSLKYKEPPPTASPQEAPPGEQPPWENPKLKVVPEPDDEQEDEAVEKSADGHRRPVRRMMRLAQEFLRAEGLLPSDVEYSEQEREAVRKSVDGLVGDDRELWSRLVSAHVTRYVEGL